MANREKETATEDAYTAWNQGRGERSIPVQDSVHDANETSVKRDDKAERAEPKRKPRT